MKPASKFYRDFAVVLVLCTLGAFVVSRFFLHHPVPVSFWLSTAVISIATLAIYKILISANSKRPQLFVAYFMGTLTGKLFLSAMILLVVGLTDRAHLKFTGVGFFIVYALLTAVELIHLLPLVRNSDH